MWPLETEPAMCAGVVTIRSLAILEKCSETTALKRPLRAWKILRVGALFPNSKDGFSHFLAFSQELVPTHSQPRNLHVDSKSFLQRCEGPFLWKQSPGACWNPLTKTGIWKRSKLGLGRGQSGKGRWWVIWMFKFTIKHPLLSKYAQSDSKEDQVGKYTEVGWLAHG